MIKMDIDKRFCAVFKTFKEGLQKMVDEATGGGTEVTHEEGYKYVRVVLVTTGEDGSRSKTAWGFIDKRTAEIFRAASWKAPSLNHVRGNLYDESNGLKNAHWTGPAYIWEISGKEQEEVSVTTTTAPATEVV